jgi:hypothetical protein
METKAFCRTVVPEELKALADSRDNVDLSQLIVELCISVSVLSANCILLKSLLSYRLRL